VSGLLSSDDLAQMRADLLAVIGDREEEIAFRRGDESLAAQTVRIARSGGGGREQESDGGQEARGSVIVVGDVDFDVQPGDRFTTGDVLYRVTFVRPNRDAAVTAEAEAVE
jgi:hypothetical protein